MDYSEKFKSLPETTQRFLIELVDKHGVNPLGERLIRNSRIYKITYGPNELVWHVGQKFDIPAETGKIKVRVTDIFLDWITSMEMKRPVHVVMAERVDGKPSGRYVHRYLSQDNFDVICTPPSKFEH